jgi:hypothetical protein
MKDVPAIIILLDTSEDRNSMKMKGVPTIIILLDTSEDRNFMKNEGRPSYNHTFRYL